MQSSFVVDAFDKARKIAGDVIERLVGHRINGLDLQRLMKLSALALS